MLFFLAIRGRSFKSLSLLKKPIDCSRRSRDIQRVFGRAALGLSSTESFGVPSVLSGEFSNNKGFFVEMGCKFVSAGSV